VDGRKIIRNHRRIPRKLSAVKAKDPWAYTRAQYAKMLLGPQELPKASRHKGRHERNTLLVVVVASRLFLAVQPAEMVRRSSNFVSRPRRPAPCDAAPDVRQAALALAGGHVIRLLQSAR